MLIDVDSTSVGLSATAVVRRVRRRSTRPGRVAEVPAPDRVGDDDQPRAVVEHRLDGDLGDDVRDAGQHVVRAEDGAAGGERLVVPLARRERPRRPCRRPARSSPGTFRRSPRAAPRPRASSAAVKISSRSRSVGVSSMAHILPAPRPRRYHDHFLVGSDPPEGE